MVLDITYFKTLHIIEMIVYILHIFSGKSYYSPMKINPWATSWYSGKLNPFASLKDWRTTPETRAISWELCWGKQSFANVKLPMKRALQIISTWIWCSYTCVCVCTSHRPAQGSRHHNRRPKEKGSFSTCSPVAHENIAAVCERLQRPRVHAPVAASMT